MKRGPIKYSRMIQTNPQLDLKHVETLHALYRGGSTLLGNAKVLERIFPRHVAEEDASYNDRKARAFYENVMGQVVDQVIAGLAQDPVRFEPPKPEEQVAKTATKSKVKAAKDAEPKQLDEYWAKLSVDATPPLDDTPAKTFDQVVRSAVCEALVARFGWVLCDMPIALDPPPTSLKEQEARGELHAYPVLHAASQVVDWSEKNSTLQWVRSYACAVPDDDPSMPRDHTLKTWVIWDAEGWTRYDLLIDKDGKDRAGVFVDNEYIVQPTDYGTHGFGRVPWVCFDACAPDEPNLWIADIIESQVRSLMNQECGEVYQRLQFMYQQLYEFLGKELPGVDEPIGTAQENPDRAKGRRGPGIVQERGQEDRAEYVSPDMAGAALAREGISDSRESIMRVTGQLAMAQDASGAMLRRSGDSKRQDKQAMLVLLGSAGKRALAFARSIAAMLGRGAKLSAPTMRGYENFDIDDVDDVVARAVQISLIGIKSARFEIEQQYRAAAAVLGDDTPQSVLDEVREQLEDTITQDQMVAPNPADLLGGDLEDDPADPADPPAPAPKKPGTKPPKKPGKAAP